MTSRTDNVAGVKLPVFQQYNTGADLPENIGLGAGGRKITVCREKFGDYLKALIKVASLQTSFVAMDEALKITNRRVNALENVTIPKIVNTINEINRELDELEREDFTRLKVVKRKKEEAIKAEEKLKVEEKLAAKLASQSINDNSITPQADTVVVDKKKKKNKKATKEAPVASEFEDDEDVVFR